MTPEQLWYTAAIIGLCTLGLWILKWSIVIFGSAHRISRTQVRLKVQKYDEYGGSYKTSEWPAGGYVAWGCMLLAASIACFLGSYTVYFQYLR